MESSPSFSPFSWLGSSSKNTVEEPDALAKHSRSLYAQDFEWTYNMSLQPKKKIKKISMLEKYISGCVMRLEHLRWCI